MDYSPPQFCAFKIVASGKRFLQHGQPDPLRLWVVPTAAIFHGNVNAHRQAKTIIIPKLRHTRLTLVDRTKTRAGAPESATIQPNRCPTLW
jgi:hypothetical protein